MLFLANCPARPDTLRTSISDNLFVFGPFIKLVKIKLLAFVLTPSVKEVVTISVPRTFSSYNLIISLLI